MIRLAGYIKRLIALLITCILTVTVTLILVSNYLSRINYSDLAKNELGEATQLARLLMEDYREGRLTLENLKYELNPRLNPGDVFVMITDPKGEVLAYTESAVPYLASTDLPEYLARVTERGMIFEGSTDSRDVMFLMGTRVENGYVLAGRSMVRYDSVASSYRLRMFLIMGPLFVVLMMLSLLMMRKLARPATILTEAAERLSEGELILVPEKLPFEMGSIGRAFNHMSQSLVETLGKLRYERDTMRLMVQALAEGVIAVDKDGAVLHENGAAVALLGRHGSPAYSAVLTALKDSLSGENAIPDSSIKLQRDGKTLSAQISPLPEQPNSRRGAVALVRDITEQERLERTRYDYVANISHELRTPLASMRGITEALRDGLVIDPSEQRRYHGILVSEVRRLSRLVDDLLELSSLQSNPAAFDLEEVDATEMIYELHDRNAALFAKKGIRLTLSAPGEPLPRIRSNEDRLTQALTIFLDNAYKYTPSEGEVTLRAEAVAEGVCFTVADTGIGMDANTMDHAFDRFHRAESGRSGEGSGLGLSIAREVLCKLKIDIRLESELGVGSSFSFIAPYAENTDPAQTPPEL